MLIDSSNTNIELNTPDDYGRTPLMVACQYGSKDVVQLILNLSDKSIELNAKDNEGKTAMMHAVPSIFRSKSSSEEIVQLLLENSEGIFQN